MIHVFFSNGMFGSTIEYMLRNYTKEYSGIDGRILEDGSMHSFRKQYHPLEKSHLKLLDELDQTAITTPIYPFRDAELPEILSLFKIKDNDKCILIHARNIRDCELNFLFRYYKIAIRPCHGMGIFFSSANSTVKMWNHFYNSWQDMQTWELREWFSIFYPSWTKGWVDSFRQVPDYWHTVSNFQILENTVNEFRNMINFCNLTERDDLSGFSSKWRSMQQYVINEYNLLDDIVNYTLQQQNFTWQPLNIISESIIQHRLRDKGYEIKCNNLNTFPTDAKTLYNLLEPV